MPTFTKPPQRATQLPLFQASPQQAQWGSMPVETRQQIERLIARMLCEHAARHPAAPARERGDE